MNRSRERRLRKEARATERLARQRRDRLRRAAGRWGLYGALALILGGGGAFLVVRAVTAQVYPPTAIHPHVETYPPCRICSAPIAEDIQRHILEHRPPGGPTDRPGILIQYSCSACPDVVAALSRIVERYPSGVYLAPYPRMSPRIALTTLGQLETMDAVDEARIVAFIGRHL